MTDCENNLQINQWLKNHYKLHPQLLLVIQFFKFKYILSKLAFFTRWAPGEEKYVLHFYFLFIFFFSDKMAGQSDVNTAVDHHGYGEHPPGGREQEGEQVPHHQGGYKPWDHSKHLRTRRKFGPSQRKWTEGSFCGKTAAIRHKYRAAAAAHIVQKMSLYVCNTWRRVYMATAMYIDAVTLVCKPVGYSEKIQTHFHMNYVISHRNNYMYTWIEFCG